MIITDYNEMTIDELYAINLALKTEFEINDGKIIKAINGGNVNE